MQWGWERNGRAQNKSPPWFRNKLPSWAIRMRNSPDFCLSFYTVCCWREVYYKPKHMSGEAQMTLPAVCSAHAMQSISLYYGPTTLIRCRQLLFQVFNSNKKKQQKSLPNQWQKKIQALSNLTRSWKSSHHFNQVKLISIASASRDHGEKRRKLWTQNNFFIVLKLPAHQWSWALSYSELSGVKWSSLASHTAESNTAVRGQRRCCCVACTKVQDRASHKEQLSANNKRLESTDNTNKHAEHVEDPEKTNTTKERKFKIWLLLSYVWRCH